MGIVGTIFSRRTLSLLRAPLKPTTPLPQPGPSPNPQARPTKKPLHALFTEAVGLADQTPSTDDDESSEPATTQLKNNLKQLEQDLKTFKEKTQGPPAEKMTLYTAFNYREPFKPKEPKEKILSFKKLSPDMAMFAQFLFEKGYFSDANFVHRKKHFDPAWFTSSFAVGYVKCAAHKFARDNREIAKWLSGSALKKVAMFGCPHTHKGTVFPAKRLRKYFEVPENTVCSGCSLQQSCKFANQNVWNCETNNLDLVTVMKVITSYALESAHPQLVLPDEVKNSVSQLLKELVKLSETTGD